MHINKVVVALAARIARIARVIMNRPGSIYQPRPSAPPETTQTEFARFGE